ncbi:4Fe-4S binding protein [Candidatus Micrarchaeota archaeon]|nr:4Fe-4S binding protein [Candidatus Micrarchaeota archaeon]
MIMKIPFAKPGTAMETKTGSWRTFRPRVIEAGCIKCGLCVRYCPEGCMGEVGKIPEIDFDYCKGCGICARICPKKTIVMEEEGCSVKK